MNPFLQNSTSFFDAYASLIDRESGGFSCTIFQSKKCLIDVCISWSGCIKFIEIGIFFTRDFNKLTNDKYIK